MTTESLSTSAVLEPAQIADTGLVTTVGTPRVLLFTDSDAFAGTERHILDLARGLHAQGVGVGIACPTPSPLARRADDLCIPVTSIAKRGAIDITALRILRRLIKDGQVDIIHSHNGRTAMIASSAVTATRGGRHVSTQHFISPSRATRRGWKGWIGRKLHGWVSQHTDSLIAISAAVRQGMDDRNETHHRPIAVVPNGIHDLAAIACKSRSTVRSELGCTDQTPLVVSATRLVKEKSVDTLVDAMARVRERLPDARCVIAGEGSLGPDLAKQIERAGLQDVVRLLGFRDDVSALMAAGDVFVLPSLSEPFGLVLLEAMALGRPVVATASGGPLEIVEDGVSGLLVKPEASDQMADAISSILVDPAGAQSMGEAGRARFESHFTANRMAALTAAVYRAI
ncbi:MAG: glycosyltransferase family 4 protein [Burkholderiales bacterium]|nr:glycosyltransferase family 4 protein [Phycisphaerae bacterium]